MKFRAALAISALLIVACDRSAQESSDPCGGLDASITKAVRLRKSGQNQEAETLYLETLDTVLAEKCSYQEARIWNNLGTLAIVEGRLIESLDHFQRAEMALAASEPATERERERARELETTVASNLGRACFRLGWLDEARDALRRARARLRLVDAEPQDWATVLLFTAGVNRFEGETRAAADTVSEALELTDAQPKTRASLYMEQARLALADGRFEDAERSLASAEGSLKDSENPLHVANVIADRAELEVRRGRPAAGLRRLEKVFDLAREAETPDLNLEAHALYLKSVALWKLADPKRSRRAADAALALLEGTREAWQDLGIQYLANRQDYYRHRLELAAQTEGPEDVWDVFEGYRAQGLLERASRRTEGSSRAADPQAREEIDARRSELLEAARELDALEPAAADDLVASRETRFRDRRLALRKLQAAQWWTVSGSPRSEIALAAAAEMLDDETLALVFAAGTEKLYVMALERQHGLRVTPLDGDVTQVEDKVRELGRGLDRYRPGGAQRQLDREVDELSRLLLGPIAERLDGFRRLVIVADGPLERLPFEILRHPGSGQRVTASHEVAYLPSFSVLAASRQRTCGAAKSQLLALGDPIFGSHDDRWSGADDPRHADEALAFQRLPASAAEVEAIGGLYKDATVVIGRDATRERFLAAAPEHLILHLASHARSHRQMPERSRIALSCLDAEGRVPEICDLYFVDVAALDLCGQVVVLSACDTAGGQPVAGEGILGLPWAFLRAGAATVIASLWRVADEPTAELMVAFHRHLRGGAGPAAALRQAKLELIEAGRPPADWAAFVLLGDWRSVPPSSTFPRSSGPME